MKTNLLENLVVVAAWVQAAVAGPLVASRTSDAIDYNAPATHYVPIRQVAAKPGQESLARPSILRAPANRGVVPDGGVPPLPGALMRNMNDIYLIVDIKVGNQTIPVHVDTGSSDTWIVQSPISCVRANPFGYDYIDVSVSRSRRKGGGGGGVGGGGEWSGVEWSGVE